MIEVKKKKKKKKGRKTQKGDTNGTNKCRFVVFCSFFSLSPSPPSLPYLPLLSFHQPRSAARTRTTLLLRSLLPHTHTQKDTEPSSKHAVPTNTPLSPSFSFPLSLSAVLVFLFILFSPSFEKPYSPNLTNNPNPTFPPPPPPPFLPHSKRKPGREGERASTRSFSSYTRAALLTLSYTSGKACKHRSIRRLNSSYLE